MRKVYLAGPDVFAPEAAELGAHKKAICARHGFLGVFPLDAVALDLAAPRRDQAFAIYDALEQAMRDCEAGFVNMRPFHGPSMDVGTAFEMGFIRALERPVFAYTNVAAPFLDRAALFWNGRLSQGPMGEWRGPDGMEIDGFGAADNLMTDICAARSTGVLTVAAARDGDTYHALESFERCVEAAAAWFERRDGAGGI